MLITISEVIPYLEKSMNVRVLDYSAQPLTAQGENFGSTIVAVKLKTVDNVSDDSHNETRTFHLAIKFPVTNPILASVFQPTLTCCKENAFYTEILPAFFQLQRECNISDNDFIDMFIHCYAARTSLIADSKIADSNALLALENMKVKGLMIGDRATGFKKCEAKTMLENIAKFHGLSIALRKLRPNVFNRKVKPYLTRVNLYKEFDVNNEILQSLCASINKTPNFDHHLRIKAVHYLKECSDRRNADVVEPDSPYTVISHNDLWINNILFSRGDMGSVREVKFCDFQLMTYDSLAHDLVFFLFSSVNNAVRREHMDDFLNHYHKHLIGTLKMFQCPLDDYSYEKFFSEIKRNAKYELEHIMNMLRVILAEKQSKPGEFSFDFFLHDDFVGPQFYESLRSLFNEFAKLHFI